jgi:Mor family transcriptional regulator
MPNRRTFTEKQRSRIVQLYELGVTVRVLARDFKCGDTSIHMVLTEAGVPLRQRPKAQRETKRNAKIIARCQAGESYQSVAKAFKMSKQRVYYIVNRGY